MEDTLRPVEDGIRIEREREEREAVRMELVAANTAENEGTGEGAAEDVGVV